MESETSNQQDLFEQAMQAAMRTAEPAPEAAPAVTSEAPPAEVKPEAAPQIAAPAVSESPKPEPLAPKLLKLMEREAALVDKERRLKEIEEKSTALEAKLKEFEAAQSRFKTNPTDYIRKLAPDIKPAELAKALWYEELGDQAPVEQRVQRAERVALQTASELRAELEQERQRAAAAAQHAAQEAAHNQYVGALGAFAKQPPDAYQLVKAFAATDPERVTRGLYRMAQKHAHATGGEVATPEQCAQMLETELSSIKKVFVPAEAPKTAPPAESAVSSLRNKHTTTQSTKSDTADSEALFQEALKAAQAVKTRLQ